MVIIVKCELRGKDMELLNLEMDYSEKEMIKDGHKMFNSFRG